MVGIPKYLDHLKLFDNCIYRTPDGICYSNFIDALNNYNSDNNFEIAIINAYSTGFFESSKSFKNSIDELIINSNSRFIGVSYDKSIILYEYIEIKDSISDYGIFIDYEFLYGNKIFNIGDLVRYNDKLYYYNYPRYYDINSELEIRDFNKYSILNSKYISGKNIGPICIDIDGFDEYVPLALLEKVEN